ncbi:2-C-methyl-D-erythritol 4-phosphate cytidylyltransferase [Curtobacterium sp. MCPF17_046]|uniref:IspD/TarI family cytidylyltransferase n=1 Tax=Curtobacterium sp. MCPF17_046 TaxID=2175663 RepID=UPI0015E8AE71|nr:IspD/TarI family cytidylyltransferase [Curtobacterium sp. MCPF17_046]
MNSGQKDPLIGVVLAGGVGTRFGAAQPKQLARLSGHTVLSYSLRAFDAHPETERIVIAANPEWGAEIEEVVSDAVRRKAWTIVAAGEHRNGSVLNAVASVDLADARLLVHDGVRPLVDHSLIDRVVGALEHADAVIPVIDSIDPIVKTRGNKVVKFTRRSTHLRGQSPQGFWLKTLREAFARSSAEEQQTFGTVFELLQNADPSARITTVDGDMNNIKITVPVDHIIAGQLLLNWDQ